MSEKLQQAAGDVLAYLMTITDDVQPREAQERLRAVQARHPETGMELVWEEEAYDHSFHYDVLVRPSPGATLSMSVSRDRALPWPLRGVHRWTEASLLQVNGRVMTMEDAVGHLDVLWNEAAIMQRMVDFCLIREELEQRPIEVSDDELQVGIDGLRRAHKLYTVEATERWMEQRGMTHEQLEQLVTGNLTCAKLRKRVAEGRVASYFERHRAELETAHIAQIECTDEASARRLQAAIAGGLDFFAAAQQHFVAGGAAERGLFATLRRDDAGDPLAAAIFAATPGDVVGPVERDGRYVIARLIERREARQDEATRDVIEQRLFDEWLAERRDTASITWHWGRAPE